MTPRTGRWLARLLAAGATMTLIVAPAAVASAANAAGSAWTYRGIDVCGLTSARLLVDQPDSPFAYEHTFTFYEATLVGGPPIGYWTCRESAPATPNPGYWVASRSDLYHWEDGQWSICRGTQWWIVSDPSIGFGGGTILGEPPCGAGYYNLVGYNYVHVSGSWVGGHVLSGAVYASGLQDRSTAPAGAPAGKVRPSDEVPPSHDG